MVKPTPVANRNPIYPDGVKTIRSRCTATTQFNTKCKKFVSKKSNPNHTALCNVHIKHYLHHTMANDKLIRKIIDLTDNLENDDVIVINPTNESDEIFGICCYCGENCNPCSQSCGHCMRSKY